MCVDFVFCDLLYVTHDGSAADIGGVALARLPTRQPPLPGWYLGGSWPPAVAGVPIAGLNILLRRNTLEVVDHRWATPP